MGRQRAGRADEAGRRRGGEAQVVVRVVNCGEWRRVGGANGMQRARGLGAGGREVTSLCHTQGYVGGSSCC